MLVKLFRGTKPSKLKEGETVQCLQNEISIHLTVGKCYKVLGFDGIRVKVENDLGTVGWYQKSRFLRVKSTEGGE